MVEEAVSDKRKEPAIPPKPRAERFRPELTRLPALTPARRLFRWLLKKLCWAAVRLLTRCDTHGLEKLPRSGSALLVANHLGDADFIVGVAFTPRMVDALAKSELYDFPLVGWILDAYGVIWLHRGLPDRRALHAALEGLARGRCVAIAPEGRESVSGSLEEGMGGAAYLAFKSGVNLVPVTFTGTENARIYRNLKHLKRTHVSLTIGEPFELENTGNRREDIRRGTELIMTRLAQQLPQEYQGVYAHNGGQER